MKKIKFENLAEDDKIAAKAFEDFRNLPSQLYSSRQKVEFDWLRYVNMFNQKNDGHDGYVGRSAVYVPELKRVVNTNAKRQKLSIIPEDGVPLLSATPETPVENRDIAKTAVEQMMHYHLKKMGFSRVLEKFLLQFNLLGNACIKGLFEEKKRFILERTGKETEATIYRGPKAKFVSMFDVYFYPDDCATVDDIKIVVERVEYSEMDIKRLEEEGVFAKGSYEKIKNASPNKEAEMSKRMLAKIDFGLTNVSRSLPEGENPHVGYQIWCEHDFGEGYRAYCIEIFLHAGFCARVIRNPFPLQRPPYFYASLFPSPEGTIYGQGWGDAIDKLQYLLNDTLNQGLDSANFLNNPVMRVDLGLIQDDPQNLEFAPGTMVYGNKEGFEPITMGDPVVVQTAFNSIGILKNLIREHGGEPSINTALTGKARSATQASIVANESSIEVKDPVEKITNDCLVPMCEHFHSIIDFHYDENVYTKVIGAGASYYSQIITSAKDFLIKYRWGWKGAQSTSSEQMRSMQMINFLNVIGQLPPQMMQSLNVRVDKIIKRIWSQGFQLPDEEGIIEDRNDTTDPDIENRMAKEDMFYDVHMADEDQYHEMMHAKSFSKLSDKQKAKMAEHIVKHRRQMQQKQMQQQMMMQQQAMLAQQQEQAGSGRKPGNPSQPPMSDNPEDASRGQRMF